jgi:hypothetical protein
MKMNNCPKCNTSWIGDKIPDDIAGHYSDTHWRREIGIDGGVMGIYDGLVAIRCCDCGEEFPVSNHPVHLEMFDKYMKMKGELK